MACRFQAARAADHAGATNAAGNAKGTSKEHHDQATPSTKSADLKVHRSKKLYIWCTSANGFTNKACLVTESHLNRHLLFFCFILLQFERVPSFPGHSRHCICGTN